MMLWKTGPFEESEVELMPEPKPAELVVLPREEQGYDFVRRLLLTPFVLLIDVAFLPVEAPFLWLWGVMDDEDDC